MRGVRSKGWSLWKLCQIGIAAASAVLMLAAACEEEKMVDCGHIGEQKESTCEWWQDRIQWEGDN